MSNGNKPSALDILSCRKLVELYYGVPMVAFVKETLFYLNSTTPTLVLGQDPRRIKYEITLSHTAATTARVFIGSRSAMDAAAAAVYAFATVGTLVIERDFFTELDAACLELWASTDGSGCEVNVREIILTPSAIDEIPDV